MQTQPPLSLVLCRPTYFSVDYVINAWMAPDRWHQGGVSLYNQAQAGWQALHDLYVSLGARVEVMPPVPGLPDMVFTANAAVILDGRCLLARFRVDQRRGEELHLERFFYTLKRQGALSEVHCLPPGLVQEGAGDCLWDKHRQWFWAGYGPRSSEAATRYLAEYFEKQVIALELTGDFYHIDLSLNVLPNGDIMYHPGAFTPESRARIESLVPPERRIVVGTEDAQRFTLNAVSVGSTVIFGAGASDTLRGQLRERGFDVRDVPVEAFGLAGGSCCCMTLRLDHRSQNQVVASKMAAHQ